MLKEGFDYARRNKLEAALLTLMGTMAAGAAVGGVSVLLDELGLVEMPEKNEALEKRVDESANTGMIPLENGMTAEIV